MLAVPAAEPGTSKHGPYDHFTPEEKVQIGKRAAKHGVMATICYFSKVYPSLKEVVYAHGRKSIFWKSPEREKLIKTLQC